MSNVDDRRIRWAAAVPAVVLPTLAYFIFGRIFAIRPLGEDNLYILSWVARAPISALLRLDPAIYPEWRPLAFQTIWLQYRWSNINNIAAYFVVNLALWTTCAWLVFRIVDLLTRSTLSGLIAASLVLSDGRAVPALTWIVERQSSMACLFGLMALLVVIRAWHRCLSRLEWCGICGLLLASALSKEYGLAFSAALAISSFRSRRRDLGVAAVAAVLVYAALRVSFAQGATFGQCPDSGYFFSAGSRVCTDRLNATTLKQMTYNVAATGVGTLLPGLLEEDGRIGISRLRLASSAFWLSLAAVGWMKGSKPVRLILLIVLCSTSLSFMIYRGRDQLVALCALAVAVGVGLTHARAAGRTIARSQVIQAVALTIMLLLLAAQVVRTRASVSAEVNFLLSHDPCYELTKNPRLDRDFVRHVKTKYGMSDPECTGTSQRP